MKLLHLDSSILGAYSVSRVLSAEIVARETAAHPDLVVEYHDLGASPLMHLSPTHIAAWQGHPAEDAAIQKDLAAGGQAIESLFASDIIVIGAPMYNFGISTQLKSWIDRVVVAGKTFKYTETGPVGLLPPGKTLFIASSRGGGYGPQSPAAFLDHQETYLRGVFGFMGVTDITVIRAEGIAMGPEAKEAAMAEARKAIAAIAA